MAKIKLDKLQKDLVKYILFIQKNEKEKRGIKQYSQELVIMKIIREHKEHFNPSI